MPDFFDQFEDALANMVKTPDVFVAVDYTFNVIYVNSVAERYYKMKRHELVGSSMEVVFPRLHSAMWRGVADSVAQRKAVEKRYPSAFDTSWVQLNGRPFENYYAFTLKVIDHKEMLRSELRQQVKRGRSKD